MKKVSGLLLICVLLAGSYSAAAAVDAEDKSQKELTISEVCEFLKSCGHYFIATEDGDQPRVRPFGTATIFEGKLYIQTSKQKRVAKQLKANPKIEICAFNQDKGQWIRIEATAVADDRVEAKQFMLDQYPDLKKMYSPTDDKTLVLYLTKATARLSSFTEEERVLKF